MTTTNRQGKTPFNQVEIPLPGKMNDSWFRRHIIFDQFNKTVLIQVLWGGHNGTLKRDEYDAIKAGLWAQYIPKPYGEEDYGKVIGSCIQSGYTVKPFALIGGAWGELHTIMQIIDCEDAIRLINNLHMKAISDNSNDAH